MEARLALRRKGALMRLRRGGGQGWGVARVAGLHHFFGNQAHDDAAASQLPFRQRVDQALNVGQCHELRIAEADEDRAVRGRNMQCPGGNLAVKCAITVFTSVATSKRPPRDWAPPFTS